MIGKDILREIHKRAAKLFESGIVRNALVQSLGKVQTPIPIHEPGNNINSWFVAITAKDRIVGFMQFGRDLKLMRYSTFQHDPTSLKGCPKKEVWLDPNHIMKRARTKASPSDRLSSPFLTYDRNPSRIVWRVKVRSKNGRVRSIFVAGDLVYRALVLEQ